MITTDHAFARLNHLAHAGAIAAQPEGLGQLPYPVRFVLADVLSQIAAGERAALVCARRLAAEDPRPDARAVAVTQVRDEMQHLAFFESALAQLDVPHAKAMTDLAAMFDTAAKAPDLASLIFGTHLVVEPLAHELFRDLAMILGWVAARAWLPARWTKPLAELGWGLAAINGDESRHVAFGALRLRALRESGTPSERAHIDAVARGWRERMEKTLLGLPILRPMRPYFRARVHQVVRVFDTRVADAGVQL